MFQHLFPRQRHLAAQGSNLPSYMLILGLIVLVGYAALSAMSGEMTYFFNMFSLRTGSASVYAAGG